MAAFLRVCIYSGFLTWWHASWHFWWLGHLWCGVVDGYLEVHTHRCTQVHSCTCTGTQLHTDRCCSTEWTTRPWSDGAHFRSSTMPIPTCHAMPIPQLKFLFLYFFPLECLNAIIPNVAKVTLGLEIKWNPKPGPCQLLFPEITFCALGTQRFGSATNFGSVHYPKPTVSLSYSILLLKRQEDDTDAVEKKYVCRCSVFSV